MVMWLLLLVCNYDQLISVMVPFIKLFSWITSCWDIWMLIIGKITRLDLDPPGHVSPRDRDRGSVSWSPFVPSVSAASRPRLHFQSVKPWSADQTEIAPAVSVSAAGRTGGVNYPQSTAPSVWMSQNVSSVLEELYMWNMWWTVTLFHVA